MKHLLFVLVLLFIAFVSGAQTNAGAELNESTDLVEADDEALEEAGAALRRHTTEYYIGTGLLVAGVTLTSIAAAPAVGDGTRTAATVGIIATVAGTVLQIISHRHIGKAGKILQQAYNSDFKIQPASSGLGLAYNF